MAIAIVIMFVAVGVSVFYLFDATELVRSAIDEVEVDTTFAGDESPLYAPTDREVEVRLFFPGPSNDVLLRTRTMTIFESEDVANRVRQIIEHLTTAPEDTNLHRTLPEGTRLNQVFVSSDRTAYVDFNSALVDNHPGGILPEQATVYAIVNSLAFNIEEIDRVKFLINGVEKETLAGHTLLELPLRMDLTNTDVAHLAESEPPPPAGQ
jgi:hypothetical protein